MPSSFSSSSYLRLCLFSGSVLSLLPALQIGVLHNLWLGDRRRVVNRDRCMCSCWDRVFKGNSQLFTSQVKVLIRRAVNKNHVWSPSGHYESGVGWYKHVYFNATANTLAIYLMSVVCLLLAYEVIKRAADCVLGGHYREEGTSLIMEERPTHSKVELVLLVLLLLVHLTLLLFL